MSFQNKHVVITGGVKGIGGACTKAFRNEGARVSVVDVDREAGNKMQGQGVAFYHGDVSREDVVTSVLEDAIRAFGEIDVLVNNAGIQRYAAVADTSLEEWDLVMNVNLKSAFLCAKHAIPSMLKKRGGVIVNVSSVQAFLTQTEVAAYTTSKTALLGLTRSIAVDYAPAIRCVAVCPGTIDTPMLQDAIRLSADPQAVYQECIAMHPLKKVGTPEEVADFILFLASEKASFITGQAYRIDGGLGITIGGSKRD